MSTLKVDAIRHNSATSDAITTASDGTCTANITSNYSNRSVVYNGAMKIAQRGTNFTGVTASGTFPVDRFLFHVGSLGTWTLSQSTDVPTGQGLSHSIKCDVTTANASPSGTAYARIDQRFEGQDLQRFCKGTSSAKNFAVSFWVKSPKTGTHIVQLQDQDNSRTVSKAYTVSSANTWEKKELIFPADTTGAFGNDNGGSLFLCFYLAVGTGYQGGTLQTTWGTPVNNTRATGQVNVADSTSNDFYLTGVQMEASSYCSEFEHRSFGDELKRCSRYYQKIAEGNQKAIDIAYSYNSQYADFVLQYPMGAMRANPSLDQVTGADYYNYFTGTQGPNLDGAFIIEHGQITQSNIYFDPDQGLTAAQSGYLKTNNSAAYLALSAEL